jgi:hypothetical protein
MGGEEFGAIGPHAYEGDEVCICCAGRGRVLNRVWTRFAGVWTVAAEGEEQECPRCNGSGQEPPDEEEDEP